MFDNYIPTYLETLQRFMIPLPLEIIQQTRTYKAMSKYPWNTCDSLNIGMKTEKMNSFPNELDFINNTEFDDLISNKKVSNDNEIFVVNLFD